MHYRCAQAFLLLAAVGCGTHPAGVPPSPPPAAAPIPRTTDLVVRQTAPPQAAPAAETKQVSIESFAFSPRTLTVAPGTRITWVNHDDAPHTATSSARPRTFSSGALDTDDSFSFVFTTPGTYDYFCAIHPHMTGQVIVK